MLLLPSWSREVAHHVDVAFTGFQGVNEDTGSHRRHHGDQRRGQIERLASAQHGGDHRADQRHQNTDERKVLNELHQTSSFPASAIISSRLRV